LDDLKSEEAQTASARWQFTPDTNMGLMNSMSSLSPSRVQTPAQIV
jgi:hypothetical protein